MPTPLYSARFVAGPLGTGSRVEYAASVGTRQVIRDFSAVAEGSSGDAFLWGLVLAGADVALGGDSTAHAGNAFSYHWEGRQVMNSGDILYVVTSATLTLTFSVSGYIFQS